MWELLEEYVKESDYRIYGNEEDGVILGIITASRRWAFRYEGKVAIIEDLVVVKDHRGEGIVRKLVRLAEDRMAEDGEEKGIEVSSDLHRRAAHRFLTEMLIFETRISVWTGTLASSGRGFYTFRISR